MATSRDGVEIAYDVHGRASAAPAVVLVHGWSCDRSYWSEQVDFLADRCRVINVDLGGHGESSLGRSDWTLPAFGDDVVAAVDEVGPANVVLVGHSMGGDAITYAATQLGDRVTGVVWVDTVRSLYAEPPTSREQLDTFLAPFRADFTGAVDAFVRSMFAEDADPDLVARVAADMCAAPEEVALGALQYVLGRATPIIAALSSIAAPVVAINPDVGPTDIDSLRAHGVDVVVMHHSGHFLMMEAPERFNPLLAEVLASVSL